MRFIDETTIRVRGGDGGRGCVAFRREKFIPRGGPSGGDGGDGGSVVLVATSGASTLMDLHFVRHYRAERGRHGMGKGMHGAAGPDLELRVPLGTVVCDDASGAVLGDMVEDGQRLVVAAGGKGGRGNARFTSAVRQAPDFAQPGLPGERRTIRLELKLLADVGIVGFPNAGKSTLIRKLSRSRAKVADYPFTTLVPNLGVVDCGDDRTFVMADVPGLIRGASEGLGLGHQFLRHVERTRVLVYLLDVCSAGDTPGDAWSVLRREIGNHDPLLLERPALVCLNKTDLVDEGTVAIALEELAMMGCAGDVLVISSLRGDGLGELRRRLADMIDASRRSDPVSGLPGGTP